ncbi:hypothetical protein ATANTOWER_011294, partial [Ataeniobius toweri]|nr:hypothetical protein [Ataeniobius toweri]
RTLLTERTSELSFYFHICPLTHTEPCGEPSRASRGAAAVRVVGLNERNSRLVLGRMPNSASVSSVLSQLDVLLSQRTCFYCRRSSSLLSVVNALELRGRTEVKAGCAGLKVIFFVLV